MHIQQFFTVPLLNERECSRAVKQSLEEDMIDGTVLISGKSSKKRKSRNCEVRWMYPAPHNNWLHSIISRAVRDVNDKTFQFQLDGYEEPLQFLTYKMGHFYATHVDNGDDSVATRKLTAVIQLSKPTDYVGGCTSVYTNSRGGLEGNRRCMSRQLGVMTVFPSHLPHFAWPVLWGTRRAVVAWFHGKAPLR
jgi:predicted 2-oxoglutarate/Fe(II)-dependent dioxygenase YbiX